MTIAQDSSSIALSPDVNLLISLLLGVEARCVDGQPQLCRSSFMFSSVLVSWATANLADRLS